VAEKKSAEKIAVFFKYHLLLTQRTELTAGIILTSAAVFLHLIFMLHAGAFWRDEIGSIALATMPSLSDIWHCLKYDSFPILSSLIVRFWTVLFTNSEPGLRYFGFLTGIAILGIFWLNGRWLGYRVPLLSLALFVFNPLSITITDSIRPHGAGIFLILISFGLIWKIIQEARLWQIAAGTIAAILSVQCLYQNAFFLASIIFAGAIVTIYRRQPKKTVILIMIGLSAAISLLPYVQPIKNAQYWVSIIKRPINFPAILRVFFSALNIDGGYFHLIWCGLILLSLGIILSVSKSRSCRDRSRNSLLWYCLISIILCVTAQLFFIKNMQVPVWPRYFLPVMAITALFLDVVFASFNILNIVRIILAVTITIISFNTCNQSVRVRQTNIDMVALRLEKYAGEDDTIIINPWYLATSFKNYYNGKAYYTTLPPIEDYSIQRFDLIREKMASLNPIEPVISMASDCLASNHSIWIVGWEESFPSSLQPQPLPPAPNSKYRWNMFVYINNWEEQFLYFVKANSGQDTVLPPVTDKPVNPLENCSIMKIEGSQ
jgi:hypothetical protein